MRSILLALAVASFAPACGDDDGGGGNNPQPDAPSNVPAMITVSGAASKRSPLPSAAEGVMVAAYKNSDPNTAIATTTTDAQGNYSLVIPTNGQALDGYLKATLATYLDTYLYPPAPLAADFSGASLNIVNQGTVDTLSGSLCNNAQTTGMGLVAVLVVDANNMPVDGAMVSSTPAAPKYCYNNSNGSGFPDKAATMTTTDGIAYMLNLAPGQVTVSATKSGLTFHSHAVEARPNTLTTTIIQ